MKNLLRSEELAQFLVCLIALIAAKVSWWVYPLLVVGPDIGMLGYLVGPKTGAASYNIFHNKGIAVVLIAIGFSFLTEDSWRGEPLMDWFVGAGILLYGHSCMDRALGYGLKYSDDFHHTHLGWIGKKSKQ